MNLAERIMKAEARVAAVREQMHRANRWGESRRFAGRAAGLRLERLERAQATLAALRDKEAKSAQR